MPLPENFESLWNEAASEESFLKLMPDLKAYVSAHTADDRERVEHVLLSLLDQSDGAGDLHVLTATLFLLPLDLKNEKLIERMVRYLDHPLPEIRLAAIKVVGRMSSESSDTPGTFLSHLMRKLESEWDVRCRDRLLVYAKTSIGNAQTKLAKLCLGETADKELGPWREMFTLANLQDADVPWRDWSSFLDKLLPSMEAWDNLAWMAFRELAGSASRHSSLYRELIERISELMRIAEVVEERHRFETNRRTRYVLTEMIGPMSRRRKKKVFNQDIRFFVNAIKYDDPGICMHCLELFAELSTVPLLSSEQRTHLLTHEDDSLRELAKELFVSDPNGHSEEINGAGAKC